MNIFRRLAPTHRRILGLVAAATAAVAAASALSVPVVPEAHAEEGRRICSYSFMWKPREYTPEQAAAEPRLEDPLVKISLGLDYKKDGKCPWVHEEKLWLLTGGLVSEDSVMPDPVEKMTCEEWGDRLHLSKSALGADPCPNMSNDHLYAIFWWDPTLPQHANKSPEYRQLDHYEWYQQ